MRHPRHIRQRAALLAGIVVVLVCSPGEPATAAPGDPVEDLRRAFTLRLEDASRPTKEVLSFREKTLQARIDNLKTLGDLRRALALQGWKADDTSAHADIRKLDRRLRGVVADRFTKRVQHIVKDGDANSRLAVANLFAEMGPSVRALDPEDVGGFARPLAPLVIDLTRNRDLGVRQEALRALGTIHADPKLAVPELQKHLEKDELGPRRVAAHSLVQMLKVVNQLKKGKTESGVSATQEEFVETAALVVAAVANGLNDSDPQVRALSLEAFQAAAVSLAEMIETSPFSPGSFPFEGWPLTAKEKAEVEETSNWVKKDVARVQSLIDALREQNARLAKALSDPEPAVRFMAATAVESIGNVRLRLKRRLASLPVVKADTIHYPGTADLGKSDPLEGFLKTGLDQVVRLLTDPDVRIRRAAVDILEILGDAAATALPVLTEALSDPDKFVRWGAARALKAFPPAKAIGAVPGLARLVCDPDLSVRMAAAETLELFGPLAKDAVPALAQAIVTGDAEPRVAAMVALAATGPENAKAAVPQLVDALTHPDARVRKAAAETLGKIGPPARAAIPALRRALGDEDNDVRVNASDAILSILQPAPK
jgi:HEAT repeat protein